MRIVSLQEFLALPAGTVFMKCPGTPRGNPYDNPSFEQVLMIKQDSLESSDFLYQELSLEFEGADFDDVMYSMRMGNNSPPLDYYCVSRDGFYKQDQLFLVWNKDDLERMIERLNVALIDGYSADERPQSNF